MDQIERQETSSSNSTRSLLSFNRTRREGGDASDDTKGPLGLNTLYDPPEPAIADLIFVHGLGGGSRSTWAKNRESTLYWPKEWLPKDAGFRDVRIHSFGYNSNFQKESTLTIYDFATSLLGCMHDCPLMPRDSNVCIFPSFTLPFSKTYLLTCMHICQVPIVMVGHSMGGLVIKRVYIIAKQMGEFSSIARRIRAILFLATPHRGANLAEVLTKILKIAFGPRPFVMDLHRNSSATQAINEEFPHHCQDLQLFSFHETKPTNLVGLVVERDLATLGYVNERIAYLDADHRGVCKYASSQDPNYLVVRNALASTINSFRTRAVSTKNDLDHEQRKLLDMYLGSSDSAEDDFMGVDNARITGSCEWLIQKGSYQEWQESPNARLFWISAKPATGKTILSGKVVSYLREMEKDCHFYFFDHGNKAKSNITSFLCSMARQMALMHAEILSLIVELCRKDDQLAKADYRAIWRILYAEAILKLKLVRPQYWVIDALDECQAGTDLVPLLIKVMKALPVRIFLTSRNPLDVHRPAIPPNMKVISEEISRTDTQSDIQLFLERHLDQLPVADEDERETMKETILMKSEGCFLWVSLVLQELGRVHTSAEIRQVLEDVPSDMDSLYSRILDSMSRAPYGKELAKAILTWTVCAARPLTLSELHCALEIHLKDNVHGVKRAIASNCGQLVYVDSQSRVQVVHQTVRDFLLRGRTTSEFAIDKKSGHQELALGCLKYLNGPEMVGPSRRKLSATNINQEPSAFASYACNYLSEHIMQVSSEDDDVFYALAKFLNSPNVLAWIEYVARHSDLKRLIQTGKALRNFLQRRSKHTSPFGKDVALMDSWATDLIRLVTKFGKNLLESPSSIYHLIPPFCPPESAPRKLFANLRGTSLSLVGLFKPSNLTWGDCLSTIVDPQEQFTALGCSKTQFAIGMASGTIRVFNDTTCQEIKTLLKKHVTAVRILRFGSKEGVLVSAGSKVVRVWNTSSWEQVWAFEIPSQCMSLSFAEDDKFLLGSLKNNQLVTWDLTNGVLIESYDWTEGLDDQKACSYRRPIAAACNLEEGLLAIVYRGQDILLWDFQRDALLETYTKEGGAGTSMGRTVNGGAISVVFGHGPNSTLLAATYVDGDLVVFGTSEGIVKGTTLANAQVLGSSPDGRTLAAGDSSGTIQIYDFETLKLLYKIKSDDIGIKCLKFSRDSGRILDIRGSQCHVWDPMVLVRQDAEEEMSDTVSISTAPHESITETIEGFVLVTSLCCHRLGEVFFCGKEDGSVYLYKTISGQQIKKLLSHADGVSISSVCFDEKIKLLSSIDSSSRVMIHPLFRQADNWDVGEPIFDHRAGVAVDQLLFNDAHTRMLISSAMADTLWEISTDGPNGNRIIDTIEWEEARIYKWANHPLNPDQLILISDCVAHLYDWNTLQRLTDDDGIPLKGKGAFKPDLGIRSITSCLQGKGLATAFADTSTRNNKRQLFLWNTSDFTLDSKAATIMPNYDQLTDIVDFLITVDDQQLVFLHSDNWICTTDPQNPLNIIRHFFLPADWLTSNDDLMIEMGPKNDILFVKRDEVAVIRRGLENVELNLSQLSGRRPSSIGRRKS